MKQTEVHVHRIETQQIQSSCPESDLQLVNCSWRLQRENIRQKLHSLIRKLAFELVNKILWKGYIKILRQSFNVVVVVVVVWLRGSGLCLALLAACTGPACHQRCCIRSRPERSEYNSNTDKDGVRPLGPSSASPLPCNMRAGSPLRLATCAPEDMHLMNALCNGTQHCTKTATTVQLSGHLRCFTNYNYLDALRHETRTCD